MATLEELARLIRSKNAGPFMLTFDVMFDSEDAYRRVLAARVLTKARFAALYQVPEEEILFFEHDAAKKSAVMTRVPGLTEVPYPVQMEPNLVIEFYSR